MARWLLLAPWRSARGALPRAGLGRSTVGKVTLMGNVQLGSTGEDRRNPLHHHRRRLGRVGTTVDGLVTARLGLLLYWQQRQPHHATAGLLRSPAEHSAATAGSLATCEAYDEHFRWQHLLPA